MRGNTADPATLAPEVERLRGAFAIDRFIIVADRGMISEMAVDALRDDGSPAHSFSTLLAELAAITRNTCRTTSGQASPTFHVRTAPNPKQSQALNLIQTIRP